MGYSSRYHVASLAAVFLALAVGILIGSEVGGDFLNETRRDLEKSLNEDLDQSRAENEELRQELDRSNEFGAAASLPLVDGKLDGVRVGVVGFGSLPDPVADSVDEALRPSGARVVAVGAVREPPAPRALAESVSGIPSAGLDAGTGFLTSYGRTVGRQMVTGGPVFRQSRSELMSRSSGSFVGLDAVVIYRGPLPNPDTGQRGRFRSRVLSTSMVGGMASAGARLVGVEESGSESSAIKWFTDRRISSVDSIDIAPGRLSLVYAIAGSDGSFGTKGTADSLIPEPLTPPRRNQLGQG